MLRAVLVGLLCAGLSAAGVVVSAVTFDSAATPESFANLNNVWGTLPSSYAGYEWSGWEVLNGAADAILYQGTVPGPYGPNFAYPSIGTQTLTMSSTSPFNFAGAELEAWPDTGAPTTQSVTIQGYMGGNLVGTVTQSVYYTEWAESLGFSSPVDKLEFTPSDQYFKLDAILISTGSPDSKTPEPGTMVLCIAAALAIAIIRTSARFGARTPRRPAEGGSGT